MSWFVPERVAVVIVLLFLIGRHRESPFVIITGRRRVIAVRCPLVLWVINELSLVVKLSSVFNSFSRQRALLALVGVV